MKQRSEYKREVARRVARGARKQGPLPPVPEYDRPPNRGACCDFPRPCPFVGCRYNLALDVSEAGTIRYRAGTDWDGAMGKVSNCALDLAAEKEHTLEEVAEVLNCTRERIRQEQDVALEKLRAYGLQLPPEWGACSETEYVRSPEATDLQAVGLKEADPWIRKLWRIHSSTTDETP